MTEHKERVGTALPSLDAPAELRGTLEPFLPRLAGQGVERLVVFSYCGPGEPQFWLAYLFVDGQRHSLGTPDLRDRLLGEQLLDLVRQLEQFDPTRPPGPDPADV